MTSGDALRRQGVPWSERLRWAGQLPVDDPDAAQSDQPDGLAAWRSAVDPGDIGAFARRLRLGELSWGQALVAADAHAGPDPVGEPDWWPWFERFLESLDDPSGAGVPDSDLAWLADREQHMPADVAAGVPFSALLWPPVVHAWRQVADAHPSLPTELGGGAATDLQRALLTRLSSVATPTLLATMDADIPFGARLLRQLSPIPDDPPRDRYARFCREQARERLQSVTAAYPVLASLVGTVLRQWHATTVELLTRLSRDRPALAATFGIDPSRLLTGVTVGMGDTHHDGRAVGVLAFGDDRVVYKPRDVRLEALWADVVAAVNDVLPDEGLRAPGVIEGSFEDPRYGYAEFIAHAPAADSVELGRFYENAGRTMAVLLALSATDCHFENLIAHHDQLVLIDGEALFETTMGAGLPTREPVEERGPDSATVLQLGMLPTWMWLDGRRRALDISALGVRPPESGTTTVTMLRAINTDAMSSGEVTHPAEHPTSLPTPPGVAPDLAEHVESLVRGFADAYRALMRIRDTSLSNVLDSATLLRRRLIARATYVYASLLRSAVQPEALTSAAARGMVLEKLTRAYLTPDEERLWSLLVAEQEALGRLDVPLFEAELAGRRTTWPGGELTGWPERDAVADVRARLAGWSEEDLARQQLIIRASVEARTFRMRGGEARSTADASATAPATTPTVMADRCLARIVDDAIITTGETTWMSLVMLPDGEHVNVQPVGPSLYDGRVGLAVFLHVAGRPDLARAAVEPLITMLDPGDAARSRRVVVGSGLGLAGVGGYLRALRFMDERGWLADDVAETATQAILQSLSQEFVARDVRLDLLGGAAGLISPLVTLLDRPDLSRAHRSRVRDLLRTAGDLLVERQLAEGGWRTLPASAPLTGLAHGASGIAVALAEAGLALDEPGYVAAAVRGLAYETSTFDAEAGNWPDFREEADGGFMLGWCAGAPGIALTRDRLLTLLPDHERAPVWREELVIAAATTAAAPLLARDHLCCGNLGRAAVLRTIGRTAGRHDWSAAGDRVVAEVLDSARDDLPRSILGPPRGGLSAPGLMTGLGGAGLLLHDDDPSWWVGPLLV